MTVHPGVTQRLVRSTALATSIASQPGSSGKPTGGALATYAHALLPLFQPLPESQPVLPCLLRRLLQQACMHPLLCMALECSSLSLCGCSLIGASCPARKTGSRRQAVTFISALVCTQY
jgi:hypothetical protein